MGVQNELKEKISEVESRMSSMEELLRILLVNSLSDEIKLNLLNKNRDSKETYNSETQNIDYPFDYKYVKSFGVRLNGFNMTNGISIVNIVIPDSLKISIKEIQIINNAIIDDSGELVPCFCFKSINGMQRKRLLQENISFLVENKEVHIFSLGRKR